MPAKFNFPYIISIAMVAAMGGLLFGYDWVVIGGAKPFYEVFFDISDIPKLQGWAMSSALVGCIAGAMIAGFISDLYGRKKSLLLAAILFTLSAAGTGLSNEFTPFIFFRILGGIGIGVASTVSPLYIAEVSPAKFRGRFVSINQLTIVIGILLAQIANMLIAREVNDTMLAGSWNVEHGWRWMFWAELIPAGLFFILTFFIPESPRYFAKKSQSEKSFAVLNKIGGKAYASQELASIESTLKSSSSGKVKLSEPFTPKLFPIMLIGIVLAIFQQWCGINVIFNYAQEVFQSAGYDVNGMFMNIVITGSVNLVFTFVAMRTVDRWGRKSLMLLGSGGLAFIYLLLGAGYYFEVKGLPMLILVVLAIAIYAMSLAPVTWVVLSEIFPNRIRGLAMSIATLSLWLASFGLTFSFPLLNEGLGASGTFWLYGGISILGFLFIRSKLPETKNKSLEELEKELSK